MQTINIQTATQPQAHNLPALLGKLSQIASGPPVFELRTLLEAKRGRRTATAIIRLVNCATSITWTGDARCVGIPANILKVVPEGGVFSLDVDDRQPRDLVLAEIERQGIELAQYQRDAVLAAFAVRGPYAGRLHKDMPSSSLQAGLVQAAWLALQPNHHKATPARQMRIQGRQDEAANLLRLLTQVRLAPWYDLDMTALVKAGAW